MWHFKDRAAAGFLGMFVCLAILGSGLPGQDEPPPDEDGDDAILRLRGSTRLSIPEGSDDEDASGRAILHQRGERMALHVHVSGLEPGVTYGVSASLGDQTEEVGSITTYDDEPKPPRCFKAALRPLPDEEEPAPAGDGGGGHWWRDRGPRGAASVYVNSEGNSASYSIWVSGLENPVVAARIALSDDSTIDLDAQELEGTFDLDEAERALLDGATVEVLTAAEGEDPAVALAGDLKPCLSDSFRERLREWRAGRGALRLDSERGDAMPFGVDTVAALAGVTISVADGEGAVVLSGTIDEIVELEPRWWCHHRDNGGDDAGGGAAIGDSAEEEDPEPFAFALSEPHDASFLRGDANDDGRVDIGDSVRILACLFRGAAAPYCPDAMDADDDGDVTIVDSVRVLLYLFQDGPPLAPRSFDRSADALTCSSYEG